MTREELLQQFAEPISVLDHGYVRFVDVMGDDQAIVDAARVSYDKDSTKHTRGNRDLLRYLMRHQHNSPYEMCEAKFEVQAPIAVARMWVRHRTANWNEFSGRYSEMPELFYVPPASRMAKQDDVNKQGSGAAFNQATAEYLHDVMEATTHTLRDDYTHLIDEGLARELARLNLPISQYTRWIWKIDLRNLLHFIHLRMDSHAQYEIQVYAKVLWQIVQAWVPLAAEAFMDFVLDALTFSGPEQRVLRRILTAPADGVVVDAPTYINSTGEEREFAAKLKTLLAKY